MASKGKTHYEVLDLPREATPDDIRRRFRELARKFHPDHHREHPEYHEIFVGITQAYQVLSDENKRAAYDLDLRQAERRQQDFRGAAYGSAPNGARPGPSATSRPDPSRQRPSSPGNQAQAELSRRREAARRKLEDAKYQYLRGNLRESKRFCTEGLEYARMGELYELLGDIAAGQKRMDRAVEHYTVAAQMLPTNGLIMAKLNRVMERQGPAARRVPPRTGARGAGKAMFRIAMSTCGLALVMLLCLIWPALGAEKLEIFPVRNWTYPQIFFMLFAGLAAGANLAIAGVLGAVQDELVVTPLSGNRRPFPVGAILGLFGIVFMPLAFIAYMVVSFRAQTMSLSVMTLFGAATALMLIFATVATGEAQGETLLFGGNVIFVSMLAGWIFGDLFRPRWA